MNFRKEIKIMKIINVTECGYNIKCLYEKANSPARRALMGYMIKTGRSDDLTFGGAFALLEELEGLGKEVYKLSIGTSSEKAKEIIAIVEVAQAGGFNKFAMSKTEIRKTSKRIKELL